MTLACFHDYIFRARKELFSTCDLHICYFIGPKLSFSQKIEFFFPFMSSCLLIYSCRMMGVVSVMEQVGELHFFFFPLVISFTLWCFESTII